MSDVAGFYDDFADRSGSVVVPIVGWLLAKQVSGPARLQGAIGY